MLLGHRSFFYFRESTVTAKIGSPCSKILWKWYLIAFSMQSTSPIVIEESLGFIAFTFLMIVSKVGSRLPKKQLSSPCNMSSPLANGLSALVERLLV